MQSQVNQVLMLLVVSWFTIVAGDECLMAVAQEDVGGGLIVAIQDEITPEEKAVQDSLQGMWIAVTCEQGGKKLPQPAVPCLVFEEDRFTIEEGKRSLEGQYQINSMADPKQLVMSIAGRGGLTASFGFEAGKLAFCFDPTPNAPAPDKLESVEGDDRILVVLAPVLVRRFEGHTGPVGSVAFSPDGKLVASGSGWPKGDRTIRIWNASSGEEIRRIDIAAHITEPGKHGPQEVAGEVRNHVFSADGRHLLVGGAGGFVQLYDVTSGKLVRRFEGHQNTVHGVALSADGRFALATGRESRTTVWDAESGDVLRQMEGHKGYIRSLALSPDGRRAISGGFDRTVRLWDVESGEQLRSFETDGWVFGLAFSADVARWQPSIP